MTPTSPLTPVQMHGRVWVKRDDLFEVGGSRGGKVRSCLALAQRAAASGVAGLVTAGSRQSPQVNIVATIAARLGLGCRAHVPAGPLTPELVAARSAGAELVAHRPGYNTVIVARARDDAATRGWAEIPFGMEHPEAVTQTAAQVASLLDLRPSPPRIVVPIGSGMSAAGVVTGLARLGLSTPVLGVCVGAAPSRRLDRFAPGWRTRLDLVQSPLDYHDHAPTTRIGDIDLDPVYEAKCLPFLRPDDLLWVVGCRATHTAPAGDGCRHTRPLGLPVPVACMLCRRHA